eukprot:14458533-Alexandrium_andersonii.AAC.1
MTGSTTSSPPAEASGWAAQLCRTPLSRSRRTCAAPSSHRPVPPCCPGEGMSPTSRQCGTRRRGTSWLRSKQPPALRPT